MSKNFLNRLSTLVRKFKPDDCITFRRNFREELASACASGAITTATASTFLQAADQLESWHQPETQPHTIVEQWRKIEPARSSPLDAVVEAFLGQIPVAVKGLEGWLPYLTSCVKPASIHLLLRHHRVEKSDLQKLAVDQPKAFYQSAMLDVGIELGLLADGSPIWHESAQGTIRPPSLMSAEQAVARWYIRSRGEQPSARISAFLIEQKALQGAVLRELLAERLAALRLAQFLASPPRKPANDALAPLSGEQKHALLQLLMQTAVQQLDHLNPQLASIASAVLTEFRCRLVSQPDVMLSDLDRKLMDLLRQATVKISARALALAEADNLSAAGDFVTIMNGAELYHAVRDHLQQLPTGVRDAEEDPEQTRRYDRFRGSKEVLSRLIRAIEKPLDDHQLRDELEVVLFNSGVKPLGQIGDVVLFHAKCHEACEGSDLVPGDDAVIVKPGRRLGDEDGLILSKALVRAPDSLSDGGIRDGTQKDHLH